MSTQQKVGCAVLFYDRQKKMVLVFRRDNKDSIDFPAYLDLLGGHVEEGENPAETIVREMAEELQWKNNGKPYVLTEFDFFQEFRSYGYIHHIYCRETDFGIDDVNLLEGQYLEWLTESQVNETTLAYDFGQVLLDFFASDFMA